MGMRRTERIPGRTCTKRREHKSTCREESGGDLTETGKTCRGTVTKKWSGVKSGPPRPVLARQNRS